jgi:hypothetical protein
MNAAIASNSAFAAKAAFPGTTQAATQSESAKSRSTRSTWTMTVKALGIAMMLAVTTVVGFVAAGASVNGIPAGGRVELSSDSHWTLDVLAAQGDPVNTSAVGVVGTDLGEGER